MDNYPYIIGGLPVLSSDFEVRDFSYGKVRDAVCKELDEKDRRLVALLEEGLDSDKLDSAFYDRCGKSDNSFIRSFFAFDLKVRTAKVTFIAGKPVKDDSDDGKIIAPVLNEKNIIDRERRLDRLYWDKCDEITRFDVMDLNIILSFLAKAHITERWCRLDREKGAEFLTRLVREVRGTFKGVEYE